MSSVDSRIVTMKFDNKQFQEGAASTMSILDKLKSSLGFPDAGKGLEKVSSGAEKASGSMGSLNGGVSKVSAGFVALATVGITALTRLANKAITVGTDIAKTFTVDPIKDGFAEYELKMGSIQTIMAGSGESLKTVNGYLNDLNTYSDKTIYSFKDMTSNIGKFTNAGVSLDKSVAAIQGISNAAALSGANANEASRSMYNFAQSISAGSVKLIDWKSIELANMATKEFKTQLLEGAVASGTLTKGVGGMYKTLKGTPVSATKGFNESLTEQWLTSESLVDTLGKYADETTDIGARATAAASDVKTFSQMMDTLKETAGSGWAQSSELIFGNFEEAKELWTGVNTALSGMIDASSDARNKILKEWKDAGGRDDLFAGISNAFKAFMQVVGAIKGAFQDIFPPATGKQLAELSAKFREFTEKLTLSGVQAAHLRQTFKGVFAIFSIAKQIISGFLGVIFDLVGSLTKGSGGFLKFTAGIGRWLTKVDLALKNGTLLEDFFNNLSSFIQKPIDLLKKFGQFLSQAMGGTAEGGVSALSVAVDKLGDAFSSLPGLIERVADAMAPLLDFFVDALSGLGQALADSFDTGSFDSFLSLVNTALFGGLVLLVKKFVSGGGIFGESGGGMFEGIADTFSVLTGSLKTMQTDVKANTLLKIAAAVGILAASIVALSLIDQDKLETAVAALAIVFAELLAAMAILGEISKSQGMLKMPFIAASLIGLSIAIYILSSAVKKLGDQDLDELGKGLLGVAGVMGILVAAVKPLSANAGGMIRAGIGVVLLAIGIKILASAVEDFAALDAGDIIKGLLGIAGALTVIIAAMAVMPPNMVLTSVSILVLSVALKILADVVKDFGDMDAGNITKGLLGMAGALVAIAGAMWAMPPHMALTAAGLVLVALALQGIGRVIESLGDMSWEEIARGLVALGGGLVVIAGGLYLMSGTLAGSAALLVAAGALAVLTPVLTTLGSMSWEEIIKGLLTLAGAFTVLGLAGLVLGPLTPVLVLLGLAILGLGAGLALAGAGVLAFSTGLAILVGVGGAAATVIGAILSEIIKSIPRAMKAFAKGIIEFAKAIADGVPEFMRAFGTILKGLLQVITENLPKMDKLFRKLMDLGLTAIEDYTPKVVSAGFNMIIAFLDELSDNIYKIVDIGGDLIIEFIRGIGDKMPDVVDEAARTVIKFVNGVAAAVDNHSEALGRAGGRLGVAIVRGMATGIAGGVGEIASAARRVAESALNAAKSFLGINSPSKVFMEVGKNVPEGFALGINKYARLSNAAAEDMGASTLAVMKTTMGKLNDALGEDLDMAPVISPVLDLSQVQREASKLSGLVAANSISAGVSLKQASSISSATQNATVRETADTAAAETTKSIVFEQNNYSPETLSAAVIYNQTRNQISLAREALSK